LIYLAEDGEQWWSLMNTCSKMCEKFIKYLTVYMLLKICMQWKGLAGQVYLGMGDSRVEVLRVRTCLL